MTGATSRLALLGLLAAGCTGGTSTLGARFNGPTALAPFEGITSKVPGVLRPYVAVANSRGDELRIVDPADDTVVIGPGLIFPLAVPTLAARPSRLVSATLGDGGSDLLVALGTGSLRLELVSTWDAVMRVVSPGIDLADGALVLAGDEILSLAAAPLPATPGRARVFAGLSGGRLAVVEFRRSGQAIELAAPPQVLPFSQPFEALDLAPAPTGDRVFCATLDPLLDGDGKIVRGVAQVEVPLAAAGTLSAIGLDALAPTRLVAVARLAERSLDDPDKFYDPTPGKAIPNRLQLYAVLDDSACGLDFPVNCGLVTVLPASGDTSDPRGGKGGILPDPKGELPYRAPIAIPGRVSSIVVSPLPTVDPPSGAPRQILIAPGVGQMPTTAILAAASTAGAVHFIDLGRMALPSDFSYVADATAARAVGATRATHADEKGLALVLVTSTTALDGTVTTTSRAVTTSDEMGAAVTVTPGYTSSEDWAITWRGVLPAFSASSAAAVLEEGATGARFLAFKGPSGLSAPNSPWKATAVVDLPELGVRVGDLVEVQVEQSAATAGCFHDPVDTANPNGLVRARVAEILPRNGADWPGGALRLDVDPADARGCMASLQGQVTGTGWVRAQRLLLTGSAMGYAGRPNFDVPYALRWRPEDPAQPADELILIKKARRRAYPPSNKCAATKLCNPVDPLAPGPVLAFTVTKADPASSDPTADTAIFFRTQSGFQPMGRRPPSGPASPAGVAGLDLGTEDVRFFASFIDDQVADIPSGLGQGSVVSIR